MQTKSLFRLLTLALPIAFGGSALAAFDPDLLEGLKARAIGPAAVGGRIAAIDAVQSDPNRIVIGVATGGVWMSGNGGLTWEPVFDEQAVASIGAVAINQANPDIIWVGTGEGNTRNSTSIGGGIYKSIDGGRSWKLMGLAGSERINRIALHPSDPETLYVAALGTLWGPNEERGLYKTTDGGESWRRILYVDENTGATDIKMDPSNPDKLLAGMWQFRRWPYHFKSGGPGSGMYLSYDGGETWQRKTEEDGLPTGELGRMAFSFSALDPDRVYALVEAGKSALLRSEDGGASWSRVNEAYNVMDRPFYYTEIIADPENPDRVYNMATRLRVSIDGGRNFETVAAIDCCAPGNTIHIDNHAFWINPSDPRHLIIGNDGGIAISRDRGDTWRFVRNLPLAQFYHIAVDDAHPYHIYGGLQDNGSWRGPSEVRVGAGIRNLHWQEVGFGDGFDTLPDPENDRAGYAQSQGGFLFRYNLDTGEQRMIRPAPPGEGVDLRFNWNAGIEQDPFDPATIYYGSQYLHKSTDRGDTWTVISGDLTSNDPDKQTFRTSGGLTSDVTSAENYTSIVAVAASKLQRGVLWVGTDDGRVHVTRDGGGNWSRIDARARGVPAGAWVPMIAPSPHDAGTAFVVFDDHRRSNMNTYVYKVTEFGRYWESLATDELSGYALSVLQDPGDPGLLFLGTEFGLFFSVNGGGSWTRFKAGVPTVSVMDMAIQERERDLVLGTHGRSVFVIDDYSSLRNIRESDFNARLKILSVTDGQRYETNPTASTRFTGSGEFRGANEPYGVMVTFMASGEDLPHPDKERERQRRISKRQQFAEADFPGKENGHDDEDKPPKVTITVSTADGEVIRTFKQAVHQGINRVTWGMQSDGVRPPPEPGHSEADDGLPPGPEVPPGDYSIALQLGDAKASADARTLADPRLGVSQEEYEASYAARRELLKLSQASVSALERIDGARRDIKTITALVGEHPDAGDHEGLAALEKHAGKIGKDLDELEKRFRNLPETRGIMYAGDKIDSQINIARFYAHSTTGAPTPTAHAYADIARKSLEEGLAAVNAFMDEDLARFREAVTAAGIGLLAPAQPVSVSD
jgi:photosystem II stability/assembly factor-like uncharacterized protein